MYTKTFAWPMIYAMYGFTRDVLVFQEKKK